MAKRTIKNKRVRAAVRAKIEKAENERKEREKSARALTACTMATYAIRRAATQPAERTMSTREYLDSIDANAGSEAWREGRLK